MKLYPFQKTGVKFLTGRKCALLADEMGLGKTIQAIDAINKLDASTVLIVCPASVKENWKRELNTWLKEPKKIEVVYGTKHRIPRSADIVILNYDLIHCEKIRAQLAVRKFHVGIFDESHYLKNPSAKRTKAVLVRGGLASQCRHKWFMTGTPVLNRPVELYPLLKAAAPDVIAPYSTFVRFARRWCGAYWDGFRMITDGATNILELNERLIKSGFMMRRSKDEVLPQLPDKQYQIIPVLPGKEKLEPRFMNWSKDDARNVPNVTDGGAELAAFRRLLAKSKLKEVIAQAKDLLQEKKKIVIFAYHREMITELEKALSEFQPAVIHGGVPSSTRIMEVDAFQNDRECRVFIGQITAAGTGITLTAADTVLFAEISWVPGEVLQAADRVHRIGQKNNVLIQFMVIEDSLEEYILRTIIDKRRLIKSLVEDPIFN